MTLLDLLILLAVLLFAASGYRRGLAASLVVLALTAAGALLGLALMPRVLDRVGDSSGAAVNTATLLTVLVPAALGGALARRPAHWLRGRLLARGPLRRLDGVGGALAGAAALLGVVWIAGNAALGSPHTSNALQNRIRESTTMSTLADRLPAQTAGWVNRASGVLTEAGFPQVLNPFQSEPVTGVAEPSGDAVTAAATRAAQQSTVKVTGPVENTGRVSEGSGFVYGDGLVMTNAHVVAGVDRPSVQIGGVGEWLPATVVLYDSGTDAAVLRVTGLDAPAVSFAEGDATRGSSAVVAGYPENGGLDLQAATVATRMNATGLDIYDESTVTRDVYQIRSTVRPGNSGGPLLTTDGQVYGMVFARSTAHPDTGYALAADQLRALADQGVQADAPVGTRALAA
ncbi:MarP family serine protease [Streptomyces sp. PSKA30]|uniref:MarP family serine protease n=1 Tax=Streptomyces sp. PSKA30 TaxID=2874597 RepID=UPI001CD047E5|nr:MarP family serine protease [Streptomyces sp. PSKA30]MBZ9645599.1 MarP family serine protease [Streptomyces sp. PSKA30]